jgi:hypothetical protein
MRYQRTNDMPRTLLPSQRLKEIKKQNIGHILIFCEGSTEHNYMDYFAQIINKKENKYTDIIVELEVAGGNARRVLRYADAFLMDDDNNRKYTLYKKYLVFDCDNPKDIQTVINDANASNNEYELLVSNFLFETWLLMHYENIGEGLHKSKTYRRLEEHLALDRLAYSKKKNSRGLIRKIIEGKNNVDNAIQYARKIDGEHLAKGENLNTSIKKMNPYSNVYKLVEQFMVEISE